MGFGYQLIRDYRVLIKPQPDRSGHTRQAMGTQLTRNDTSESSSIVHEQNTTLTFGDVTPDALPNIQFDVKFHFTKTEYIFIELGSVRVTINGESKMMDASHGEIKFPQWTPHRWEVLGGEETVVMERTFPRDGRKEAFFRNFVCLINDYGTMPPVLQVFKIFAELDNYPIGEAGWMIYVRTPIVGLTKAVGWVAGLAGYRAMYKEYMPKDLYERLQ
jgi:hypothetical protein